MTPIYQQKTEIFNYNKQKNQIMRSKKAKVEDFNVLISVAHPHKFVTRRFY